VISTPRWRLMTWMDMEHHPIDPMAVADAMLARGFAQLLAPEALDDSPVSPLPAPERYAERWTERYSRCSKPDNGPSASTKFTPGAEELTASPIQVIASGWARALSDWPSTWRLAGLTLNRSS
jgi:hypothetical protein